MRCNKCGFENTTGTSCVKCGTPLQNSDYGRGRVSHLSELEYADLQATRIANVSSTESKQLKSTVIQGNMDSTRLKSTVIQNNLDRVFVGDAQLKSTVIQSTPNSLLENEQMECPKCRYPITAMFSNCPNCGADFKNEEETVQSKETTSSESSQNISVTTQTEKKGKHPNIGATISSNTRGENDDEIPEISNICSQCNKEVPAEYSFCPHCGTKIILKTIPSIRRQKAPSSVKEPEMPIEKKCRLVIIPEEDEQLEPISNLYEGTNIVLNRENTESDNRTITSKEQAVLDFENGKWFIENRSELHSTLIVVGRKMELNSGDVVMLGNRRFKFETN